MQCTLCKPCKMYSMTINLIPLSSTVWEKNQTGVPHPEFPG